MSRKTTRRDFIKSAATVAAIPTVISARAWGKDSPAPSEQVTLGCIGMGNHGIGWNLKYFLKISEARVVAVCDVFADRREKARSIINGAYGNQDCTVYADFRELLARDDIDGVVISTPDHWHVLMSVMAARAGKDVFCEKPPLTIQEGEKLTEVIAQTGVMYQGGIEDRSVDIYHRMAELVRNGAVGTLERIRVALPPGDMFPKEEPVSVPAGLDYDMWLGPAPFSPYTPTKLGAQEWRNDFDYSGGKLTDWGAHLIDTAQVALYEEHGGPVSVDGKGEFPVDCMANTATTYEIDYEYASGVTMKVKSDGAGIRFDGSDGWIKSNGWRKPIEASDPALLKLVYPPETNKMYPRPPSEHQAFINAVKSRKMPYYSPEDIHRLSSAMHMGNISMRLDRKLTWDPVKEEFANDDEANGMRSRAMRGPWTLEG
ncbi:MAG: Gfo/Idh/MocA family oxidoreductase [Candidatus Hydrogenedentes bacterium]|nr:Gfo/Idh/MocA family oxidoreductase [Candidatus Hydrogenedentota bacterium]